MRGYIKVNTKFMVVAILTLSLTSLCLRQTSIAAVFNPATAEEFREALGTAGMNGEDNSIMLPECDHTAKQYKPILTYIKRKPFKSLYFHWFCKPI